MTYNVDKRINDEPYDKGPPDPLPCPFCGCAGEVVNIDGAWNAGCSSGQYSVDDDHTCRANAISFYHRTREGAIAAWNRRAVDSHSRSFAHDAVWALSVMLGFIDNAELSRIAHKLDAQELGRFGRVVEDFKSLVTDNA